MMLQNKQNATTPEKKIENTFDFFMDYCGCKVIGWMMLQYFYV